MLYRLVIDSLYVMELKYSLRIRQCLIFGSILSRKRQNHSFKQYFLKFSFLLLSFGPRWLMPRMYCSHTGLLYYTQTFQISPLVSFYEVLAARGGYVYEPSYFQMFQLSPLVVFKRSRQPQVELHGGEMAYEFSLNMPDFHVTFRDLLHAVNL